MWFETAYQERDRLLTDLKTDYGLDVVRSDPRHAELVWKVGCRSSEGKTRRGRAPLGCGTFSWIRPGGNLDLDNVVLHCVDDQVSNGVDTELAHDVTAMRFRGLGA